VGSAIFISSRRVWIRGPGAETPPGKDLGILERRGGSVHPAAGAIIERDGVAPGRVFVMESSPIAERTASMSAMPLQYEEIEYPYSDGKPMAESDLHRDEMMYLIGALDRRFRAMPDAYVAGNLFVYYVRGDRKSVVAPDVFLVRGVPKGKRKSFLLWNEGRGPCFVVEVTSESTRAEDLKTKMALYQRLGVEEYFLHDPLSEYLNPSLQGFRLQDGRYRTIAPEPDGTLFSRMTGLRLRVEGERLRLIDPESGKALADYDEMGDELEEAQREILRLRRELDSRR
jgi:Uma2 family endonuclease